MAENRNDTVMIPLAEETLVVDKRVVETGRVRIQTKIDEREEFVRDQTSISKVDVQRVPVDIEVDRIPEPWTDGSTLVIPVTEERLIVRKALFVVEEVRVTRRTTIEEYEKPVTLRRERAVVERDASSGEQTNTTKGSTNARTNQEI